MDLFFDHCLARDWDHYAEVPLSAFTARVYRLLEQRADLPVTLARITPRMVAQDWLGGYRDFAVLEVVLDGMRRRLSRPRLLDGALADLERLYHPLSEDFRHFYPELQAFARNHANRT